jgi:hypothetical protein
MVYIFLTSLIFETRVIGDTTLTYRRWVSTLLCYWGLGTVSGRAAFCVAPPPNSKLPSRNASPTGSVSKSWRALVREFVRRGQRPRTNSRSGGSYERETDLETYRASGEALARRGPRKSPGESIAATEACQGRSALEANENEPADSPGRSAKRDRTDSACMSRPDLQN